MAVVLSPYALTTLEGFKTAQSYPDPTMPSADDDFLTKLINAASARIEKFCNRLLAQRTGLTEFYSGGGRREFLLRQFPITTLTSIEIDWDHSIAAGSLVDPAEYALVFDNNGDAIGVERFKCLWPRGRQNIRAVYDAGYAVIPDDLVLACEAFAGFMKTRLEDKDLGLKVRSKGDENTTVSTEMPSMIMEMIMDYKRSEFEMDAPIGSY